MSNLGSVLRIVALVCFGLAALGESPRMNLTATGLFFLTLSWFL